MILRSLVFKVGFCLIVCCFACAKEVRITPATPTPPGEEILLRLIFPRPYENKRKNPVNIQMRLKNFTLSKRTQRPRSQEVLNNPQGQSIHIIIDNEPYFVCNHVVAEPPGEENKTADRLLSFPIPFNLKTGQHTIRAFPVYSYGESVKGKGCFTAEIFYFQDKKKSDTLNINLRKPYLTYNVPQGRIPLHHADPLLLDFYISNCELSPSGYKVRISIDGQVRELLTKWTPYYIYGLSKGTHRIKLELVNQENQQVSGYFNVVEREVTIY